MNTIRLKQAVAGLALIAATATVVVGVRMVGRTEPVEAGAPAAEFVERLAMALDTPPVAVPSPGERRRIDLSEARMIVARAATAAPQESADETSDETADDLAAAARLALASIPAAAAVAPQDAAAEDPAVQRFASGLGDDVAPPAFRLAEQQSGGAAAADWVPASGSVPATLELRPVPRP